MSAKRKNFRIAVAGGSTVMKTIFRFLSTGALTAAIVAAAATVGFGQDAAATPSPSCADIDGHNALYTKFTEVYAKEYGSLISGRARGERRLGRASRTARNATGKPTISA